MKIDQQLLLCLALKKAETIYFNGGDWKGFIINIMLEIEKELEKDQFSSSELLCLGKGKSRHQKFL